MPNDELSFGWGMMYALRGILNFTEKGIKRALIWE